MLEFLDVAEIESKFRFIYSVTDRTNSTNTKSFIELLLRELPVEIKQIVVVLDNHSAHRSKLITQWAKSIGLQLFFLPAYSSRLNPGKPYLCSCFELIFSRTGLGTVEIVLGQTNGESHSLVRPKEDGLRYWTDLRHDFDQLDGTNSIFRGQGYGFVTARERPHLIVRFQLNILRFHPNFRFFDSNVMNSFILTGLDHSTRRNSGK